MWISELSCSDDIGNFFPQKSFVQVCTQFLLSPNDKIFLPKNKIAGCEYFQNKFINCGGTSNRRPV
jgi:hypothetical protein